jgi:protein required for attachment to host cells
VFGFVWDVMRRKGPRAPWYLHGMNQTWIVIGDGSHARLFQATTDVAQPWLLLRTIDRENSREKTNRADSHEDRGEHDFARHLVAELEAGRQSGTFARLVLVAPPAFLGQLRGELSPSLTTCVVKSFDKDYTKMSATELPTHIDIS